MMKTKILAMVLILAAGSMLSFASAQERIKALIKKCETIESVDMNIIKSRRSATSYAESSASQDNKPATTSSTTKGPLEESVITVSIHDNETLVNEFLAAFKAEEENATDVMSSKKDGKIVPSHYNFEDGLSFSFSMRDKANATITQMNDGGRKRVYAPRSDVRSRVIKD